MNFTKAQQFIFRSRSDPSVSLGDHMAVAAGLQVMKQEEFPPYLRPAKAAFLSSYTIQGLAEASTVRSLFHNIRLETYVAPYNQFSQEVFGGQSGLVGFEPHVTYVLLDEPDIMDASHLKDIVRALKERVSGYSVVFRFVSDGSGRADRISEFNKLLEESQDDRFHVFDFSRFLDEIGAKEHWYTKYKALGDMRLSPVAFVGLAEALMRYAVAASGATKKCLVVDLDGTLWGGIIGEDSLSGIEPNGELQHHIKGLSHKGIILAINSRNNQADALEAIERHPDMILRENDFAAMRINWNDKAVNMRELAEELNIGLDSFVFLDDDEFQRELVRRSYPQVAVLAPEHLGGYAGFSSFVVTEEDKRRGAMYVEERKRKEFSSSLPTVDEFLRELNLQLAVEHVGDTDIARVSQLTQKTNQFNLTTRRYSAEEIADRIQRGWRVWSARAWDRFGDYGVIGVAMIEPLGSDWRIDNFLFSCRVLGRGLEKAFLAFILQHAKDSGAAAMRGEFIPTAKNKLCEDFYQENNFLADEKAGNSCTYRFPLGSYTAAYPEFLSLQLPL